MDSILSPPMSTLSGFSKSCMAVPSAKNSGFDKTSKLIPFLLLSDSADLRIA